MLVMGTPEIKSGRGPGQGYLVAKTQYFHTGFYLAGLSVAVHFELCIQCVPGSLILLTQEPGIRASCEDANVFNHTPLIHMPLKQHF